MNQHAGARVAGTVIAACLSSFVPDVAHAQSSVTLYGLIDTSITYSTNQRTRGAGSPGGGSVAMTSGALNASRWGLRGREDLGGGMAAVFALENGFSGTTGKLSQKGVDLFGRQAWVGVSSQTAGTLSFGRQYDLILDYVTPLGASGPGWGGNLAVHPYDNDDSNRNLRINNAVKFQSANYSGFTFGALYGFSNSTDFAGAPATTTGTTTTAGSSRAYSFGLNYANGPISVGAAYTDIRYPSQSTPGFSTTIANLSTGNVRDLRTYGVGGRYVWGPATAWLLWTRTQFSTVSGAGGTFYNAYEAGAKYAFTPALSGGLGYTYTNATQNGNSWHWNQVNGIADYALSKRTDVYGLVVYQQASGKGVQAQIGSSTSYFNTSGTGSKNQIAARIGIRHKF